MIIHMRNNIISLDISVSYLASTTELYLHFYALASFPTSLVLVLLRSAVKWMKCSHGKKERKTAIEKKD